MIDHNTYMIPQGLDEIERFYGPPMGDLARSAVLVLPQPIGTVTEIRCHPKAKPALVEFFDRIVAQGLWHCLERIAGAYVDRKTEGFPPRQALECWGAGLALNGGLYPPNIKALDKEPPQYVRPPGPIFYVNHPIVVIARGMDLTWGGDHEIFPDVAHFTVGSY